MIHKDIDEKLNNYRLDQAATFVFEDFSRTQIQRWIIQGNLLVNGEHLKAKDKVRTGDELILDPVSEKRVSWDGEDIPLNILHEEEDFLIINKSPGMVMHPGAGCHSGTLANSLAYHFPDLTALPRCGIVHRLDKDTSGVLVVAKNEKFRNFFVNKLQERLVYKKYEAVVVGKVIGSFSIDKPIERDPRNRVRMRVGADGREALSHVSLIKSYGGYSHISIEIETGRTHQIRVHLSHQRLPIIGDNLYNPRNIVAKRTSIRLLDCIQNFTRQALHASTIRFSSINRDDAYEFKAELPQDMKSLIELMQ